MSGYWSRYLDICLGIGKLAQVSGHLLKSLDIGCVTGYLKGCPDVRSKIRLEWSYTTADE